MLTHLSIRNFALIDHADIDFTKGFSVITGETGSGKSILLGALNLILGERADFSVIRDTSQKTLVEAQFNLGKQIRTWFDANDIDWDPETVIRREINAQGKSRAFINDTPVQLTQLRELTEQLIYIHSQHETLELKSTRFQLDLLDVFGDSVGLAEETKKCYLSYKTVQKERESLQLASTELQRELDYIQFQLEELGQLELKSISYKDLENELNRMGQMDELRHSFSAIEQGLTTENGPIDALRAIKIAIDKWKHVDPNLNGISERLLSCLVELDDVASEAQNQLESMEMDPERLTQLTNLVDRYNHVLRKHQLQSQTELIELEKAFQTKVDLAVHSDESIHALNERLQVIEDELKLLSTRLFTKRSENLDVLSAHLKSLLDQLKLADTQLKFVLTPTTEVDANGGMTISMLFSANKGMEMKAIEKAASGGELSRLMLAIQATLSRKKALPTLILDEIDTGVSGEVALRIGMMLHEMGQNMQILAISHLPQVAAKAQIHFEVSKHTAAQNTMTTIQPLSEEQRVIAIAKLLSGDAISDISKTNARLLMNN
jgi:DNA repair protein RecN (Recombination protein N)